MREFEVIREIPNQCSNNQMRDVFFEEIECESPIEYVKKQFPDKEVEITTEDLANGNCVIIVNVNGLIHRYSFTEI